MSVLINMEMPEKQTILTIFPNGYVAIYDAKDSFIGEAKAVPVPKHGRLIDADALLEWANAGLRFGDPDFHAGLWHTISAIEDAPTIVPADKEEET